MVKTLCLCSLCIKSPINEQFTKPTIEIFWLIMNRYIELHYSSIMMTGYTSSILSSKFVFLVSISWRSEAVAILSLFFSSCLGPQHQLDIPFHLFLALMKNSSCHHISISKFIPFLYFLRHWRKYQGYQHQLDILCYLFLSLMKNLSGSSVSASLYIFSIFCSTEGFILVLCVYKLKQLYLFSFSIVISIR